MKRYYFLKIFAQEYSEEEPAGTLHILNTATFEIKKIPLLQLANNMSLLEKFDAKDIFKVAYMAGQWQALETYKRIKEEETE